MKNKWVKGTALVMVLAVVLTVVFAGCSSGSEKLYIFAYGDYFDPDIVDMFEDEYGIEVVYEEYAAPEDMYAKATSGANDYDLICASDYIIEKMLQEDLLLPIDFANVPNFANIGDTYKEMSKSFDPELQYSVPHFWGTVGILYDRTKVSDEDVQSWSVLFDEKYADQIIMPNSERDAMLPALKVLGYDLNTTNTAELDEAANMLIEQKSLVQAYLLDEAARTKVSSGNAAMAVIYNGEAYLAFEENENVAYAVPQEGTNIWMDSWVIPNTCQHKESAEKFLDFMCREDIAAMNFDYIYYSTPNQAVYDSLDADVQSEKAIFPDQSVIDNSSVFKYLGSDTEKYYTDLWFKIKTQ